MPVHGYLLACAAAVLWGLLYVLDERLLAGISIYRLYFRDRRRRRGAPLPSESRRRCRGARL